MDTFTLYSFFRYLTPLSHFCPICHGGEDQSTWRKFNALPQVTDKFNHIKLFQVHLIFTTDRSLVMRGTDCLGRYIQCKWITDHQINKSDFITNFEALWSILIPSVEKINMLYLILCFCLHY